MTTKDLYLDLLKKTLSFSLWEDSGYPIEAYSHMRRQPMRFIASTIARVAALGRMEVYRKMTPEMRESGQAWPRHADTMVGLKRLDNIQFCVQQILADGVEGDLIETGVWRGGSCIFMKGLLKAHDDKTRRIFVADSFQGLPPPDEEKYPEDRGDVHFKFANLAVSEEQVRENFRRYDLLDDRVVFLKGWFKDTLPVAPIEKLAVMRLDGDMYESTMDALKALYPKLSKGGYCIIDDYALEGCRKAVEDYRREHGIEAPIEIVDWTGAYWRK